MTDPGQAAPASARRPPFALFILLAVIPSFSTNVFVPSMPGLVAYFQSTPVTVQLTLTLYLLTLGVGQLLLGPLSDRFGRRPVLLTGLSVYVLGTILCLTAGAVEYLIVARVIQAAGGCAGLVLGRAMIRDLYARDKAAGVLGYVTMAMAMATGLAPFIGAFLEEWWGWRASFVLMTALGGVLTLGAQRFARETAAGRSAMPSAAHMVAVHGAILGAAGFRRFGGYSVCILGSYYAFMAGAPYVVIVLFGQPPSQFGLYYILAGAAYITGNFLAGRLSERLGAETMTKVGGTIAALSGLALIVLAMMDIRHPLAIFVPISISFIGSGLSQPSAMMSAIDAVPRNIGSAAGLLGALQLGVGAIASLAVGATQGQSPLPFAAISGGFLLVALAILLGLRVRTVDPGI
ncbi:MAG: multidrug effflux MFS transporter [Alphaproteobacteria bacterium]|nr:multidrug effflux MFS transporter [Alphaproteobacteria bacterium]